MDVAPETPTAVSAAAARDGLVVRWRRLAGEVDSGLAARLVAFAHAGVAPIAHAEVADGVLWTAERKVAGEPLDAGTRSVISDKALALGTELARALQALAEAGLAHGALGPEHVVRTDDGLVVVGVTGRLADGRPARDVDDARALAVLVANLLPPAAPADLRLRLDALVASPPEAAQLLKAMAAIRAAIPVPQGRHVRSIQRLAFPPPKAKRKKSKRYLRRVALIVVVVGVGLYSLFASSGVRVGADGGGPAAGRDTRGVVYIHLPPLPKPTTPEDAAP